MIKPTLILFRASDEATDCAFNLQPGERFCATLAEWLDYRPVRTLPKPGDRLLEFQNSFAVGRDEVKQRFSDWRVASVQVYGSEAGDFNAIAVCLCEYVPMAEGDRLWREVPRGDRSLVLTEG